MTGCPFRVSVKKQRGTNFYRIQDMPPEKLVHNHPKLPLPTFAAYRTEILKTFRGPAIARYNAGETPL